MCGSNPNCKCKTTLNACGCSSADGSAYNPSEIKVYINKHLFDSKATPVQLTEAYPKVMVWLEDKKKPFTEESIHSNMDELKVIINDPYYLEDKVKEKNGWRIAAVIIVFILIGYWALKQ